MTTVDYLAFLGFAIAVAYILWPSPKDDIVGLIAEMADYGFDLNCGEHTEGLTGYFAMFYKKDCDGCCGECGHYEGEWMDAGHADNLQDAIVMAADIAVGLVTVVPGSEEFKQ